MRTEQMANKIKNQNFFQRNLFPRMFGGCGGSLSEAAGFDAGYD